MASDWLFGHTLLIIFKAIKSICKQAKPLFVDVKKPSANRLFSYLRIDFYRGKLNILFFFI
jgi:hypothetical protein